MDAAGTETIIIWKQNIVLCNSVDKQSDDQKLWLHYSKVLLASNYS